MTARTLFLATILLLSAATDHVRGTPAVTGPVVEGQYLETRTEAWSADRTALSRETLLGGEHALLAWRVERGVWNGVSLDGLSIVVIVGSEAAIGSRTDQPEALRTVVFVDERATEKERKALLSLAEELAPRPLGAVVKVRPIRIRWKDTEALTRLELDRRLEVEAVPATPRDDGEETPRVGDEGDHGSCTAVCGGDEPGRPALSRHTHVRSARLRGPLLSPDDLRVRSDDVPGRTLLLGRFSL